MSEREGPVESHRDSAALAAVVRAMDHDRYLCALFAPGLERRDLWVLAAFGAELHRIPLIVSEPMLGQIRLQWWRDAIENARTSTNTGNPIADGLIEVARRRSLPEGLLHAMVDGREAELRDGALPDEASFKAYLGKVSGSLFALSARVLGAGHSPDLERAAAAAGGAFGLARLLADLPAHRARSRLPLPRTLLQRHGLDRDGVLLADPGPALASALNELAVEALAAQQAAVAHVARLDRPLRIAFLPLALTRYYLDLAKAQQLSTVRPINPLARVWRIWRANRRGLQE